MAKPTLESLEKRITALELKQSGITSYTPSMIPFTSSSRTNKRIPLVNKRTLKHRG